MSELYRSPPLPACPNVCMDTAYWAEAYPRDFRTVDISFPFRDFVVYGVYGGWHDVIKLEQHGYVARRRSLPAATRAKMSDAYEKPFYVDFRHSRTLSWFALKGSNRLRDRGYLKVALRPTLTTSHSWQRPRFWATLGDALGHHDYWLYSDCLHRYDVNYVEPPSHIILKNDADAVVAAQVLSNFYT